MAAPVYRGGHRAFSHFKIRSLAYRDVPERHLAINRTDCRGGKLSYNVIRTAASKYIA